MLKLFGEGEVKALRLETATGLLSFGVVLLAGVLVWQSTRALPVCYGTASVAPGLVVPNRVPEMYVRTLSEQVVLVLYNITPETAKAAHDRVQHLLHPQLAVGFNVRAGIERELMESQGLSTQLSIRNTVTGRSRGLHAARIEASRRVFAGALPIRDEDLEARLRWRQTQPSTLNPWGLVLVELTFSKPLSAETG